jgi:hypothetical protein
MTRKHTATPWHVHDSNKLRDAKGERIATIVHEDAEAAYIDGRDEVNAARIAECVNACQGMKYPAEAIIQARAIARVLRDRTRGEPIEWDRQLIADMIDNLRMALGGKP